MHDIQRYPNDTDARIRITRILDRSENVEIALIKCFLEKFTTRTLDVLRTLDGPPYPRIEFWGLPGSLRPLSSTTSRNPKTMTSGRRKRATRAAGQSAARSPVRPNSSNSTRKSCIPPKTQRPRSCLFRPSLEPSCSRLKHGEKKRTKCYRIKMGKNVKIKFSCRIIFVNDLYVFASSFRGGEESLRQNWPGPPEDQQPRHVSKTKKVQFRTTGVILFRVTIYLWVGPCICTLNSIKLDGTWR